MTSSTPTYEFFASCGAGLEHILADELRDAGAIRLRPLKSGVSFEGTLEAGYRALLWTRTASRIQLVLDRVPAGNADILYESIHSIDWTEQIREGSTISISARGVNAAMRNTQFTEQKVKDAVCDMMRERTGARPDVDTRHPGLLIDVGIHDAKATVVIDLAGTPLFKRGYRAGKREAVSPLRETVAAALLLAADWPRLAAEGCPFVDPFCGSGTLLVEAALIAGDVAPGTTRSHWGFDGWAPHDYDLWDRLMDEADERAEQGRSHIPFILGTDVDREALNVAAATIRHAGLDGYAFLAQSDIAALDLSALPAARSKSGASIETLQNGGEALLATDPPNYSSSRMPVLDIALASLLARFGERWTVSMITIDTMVDAFLKRKPAQVIDTYQGSNEVTIRVYGPSRRRPLPVDGKLATPAAHDADDAEDDEAGEVPAESAKALSTLPADIVSCLEPGTGQFVARLRKVAKQRTRWARTHGVSCYRLYDADLPDYAVAIDLYEGTGEEAMRRWACITEYRAPKEIDPQKAQRRLTDVLMVTPAVLDIPLDDVFLKVRHHGKGGSQYADERSEEAPEMHVVCEGARFYRVAFNAGLDTGLFLDSRPIRERLREQAQGRSCLNLFAYTGTASVAMAQGGARNLVTQDMSQGYLDWAHANMRLNGFDDETRYTYECSDATQWVRRMKGRSRKFDLIYVDPPTFSNSTKMGARVWDVQKDHADLLIAVSRMLSPGGHIVFCCNLRDFKIDAAKLDAADVHVEDITPETIGEDFARNPKIHHCYELRHLG